MLGCDVDYDGPRCSMNTEPKARKEHRCDHCGGIIKPGERYEKYQGIDYEGRPFCDKMCADCRFWLNETTRLLFGETGCAPTFYFGDMDTTWSVAMEEVQFAHPDKGQVVRACAAMFNAFSEARGGTVRLNVPYWCEDTDDEA